MGENMDQPAEMETPEATSEALTTATPETKKKRRAPKVHWPEAALKKKKRASKVLLPAAAAKKEKKASKWRLFEPKNTVDIWAAQCKNCLKWRVIPTQEEYEQIRKNSTADPFTCNRKQDISCDDQSDLDYGNNQIWVMDKPNIPKTPAGFKRALVLRKDYSKMDCYYATPDGRKLRALTEVATFLGEHPEYKDLSVEDFSFSTPSIAAETIPQNVAGKESSGEQVEDQNASRVQDVGWIDE